MIRKALLLGAAAAAIVATTPALADGHAHSETMQAQLSAPEIEYTMWTLDNGLDVIALPDSGT